MKLLYKTMILGAALMGLAACDKTEDAYYPGPEPTDVLSVFGEIFLNADGTEQTLDVRSIAYWDVSVEQTGNSFEAKASTDRGNGTITISGKTNYGGTSLDGKLIVKARNFNKTVEIPLYQSSLKLDMQPADYPVTPEEGGDVTLTFDSSVEWTFAVEPDSDNPDDKGDISWLSFTPALPGEGKYREINAIARWSPNYTEKERVITLALEATNERVMEILGDKLPEKFTLRQAAGTRPSGVVLKQDSVGMHGARFSLSYSSKSRVERCGVYVSTEGEGERFVAATPDANGVYPETGTLSVSLNDLADNRTYIVRPYVRNRVGNTMGDNFIQFTTTLDPESIYYKGLELVNIDVYPGFWDVKIVVEFMTDVEIGNFEGMVGNRDGTIPLHGEIYETTPDGRMVILFASDEVLTPKTEYKYGVGIMCRDYEDYHIENKIIEYSGTFTTRAFVPSEGDNNPPSVN